MTTTSLSYAHVEADLRVFHGPTSLGALKRELERAGVRRALVVCGRTIGRSEALARLREALGDSVADVSATAKENSPVAGVEETARAILDAKADAIVAIGGGSAAVTSRAAAILAAEKKPLQKLCTRRDANGNFQSPRLNEAKIAQFVIPTTPSTAFARAGTAVHDASGQRLALFDPKTRARAIFIHPDFVGTAPPELVRNAALNAFANAVEALESPRCDPISEAFLLQALRLIRSKLPDLDAGTADNRECLVIAAILSGRGAEQGGAGLASVLAHAIGHRAHVANGVVNAIVLPHTMRFNAPATRERVGTILEGLRAAQEVDAFSAVAAFLRESRAPDRLRAIGVPRDGLAEIAEAAMQDWFITRNARPVANAEALREILHAAW